MAFYKYDNQLLIAPNAVYAPSFTLLKEQYTTYQYPQDGWYWFDTEAEARTFFGLPPVEDENVEQNLSDLDII